MSRPPMKVYGIQGEADFRIVEAESYGRAVTIWRAFMIREFGYALEDEPESVTMICDDPVLRAEHRIEVEDGLTLPPDDYRPE